MSDPYAIPSARPSSPLPMIDGLRRDVDAWRSSDYPGASSTSRRLLEHWFLDDHQTPDGLPFSFYFSQREAIETIIYLHEVVRLRRTTERVARYADRPVAAADDPYPRYVIKMATGSGKTKVMALAITWSYFHAIRETASSLATTSLVVAPNLIVLDRLATDFADGRAFRDEAMVPPEWRSDLDLQVVIRDDPVPFTATGLLCLTNVHLLYDRRVEEPSNPVEKLLGPRPPRSERAAEPLLDRLAQRGRVLVVNDEAHHLHDEIRADTGEPLRAIDALQRLDERATEGVVGQVDMSATPRNQQGVPFPQIIVDYPLAQAITDGIVKRPVIGELSDVVEPTSDDASIRYRQRIDAGIIKWREFRERFEPAGHKPVLFVMAEDTRAADQIADYLETHADLAGRTLSIHVNMAGRRRGEVRPAELDEARRAAREVDSDENPYHAIVSVLMLREGWDVRNVVVIVPLRPLTATSQILPEQTLGRGLRRMTRPGSVTEQVVVIEHEAFRELWDSELDDLGLDVARQSPESIEIAQQVIAVEPDRVDEFDITVPDLGRHLIRVSSAIAGLRASELPRRELRLPEEAREGHIRYQGRDLLSGDIVERAEYPMPFADDSRAVLAWFVNEVQRQARLTGQFAVLAPLVRDYIEQRAFREDVSLEDSRTLQVLEDPSARETILEVVGAAVNEASLVEASEIRTDRLRGLSEIRPFLWSGPMVAARRSVFNLQPCDNEFEVEVCRFLDRASDVEALAKLTPAARLSMEYRNAEGRLAYYYPDLVMRLTDGSHRLVEVKGRVDLDVPAKDRRAHRWAVDASAATGIHWAYVRLDQELVAPHLMGMTSFLEMEELVRARRREALESTLPVPAARSREELLALMEDASRSFAGKHVDVDAAVNRLRDDPGA